MRTIINRLSSLVFLGRPLILTFIGTLFIAFGITSLLVWASRSGSLPGVLNYLTLPFLPAPTRGILLLLVGLGIIAAGFWQLSGVALIRLRDDASEHGEVLLGYGRAKKPPQIVVLSGGAGMLMLASLGESARRLTCITPVQEPVEYYYRASNLFQAENVYYVVPTPIPVTVMAELDDGTTLNVMHINTNPDLAKRHVRHLFLKADSDSHHHHHEHTSSTSQDGETTNLPNLPLTRLTKEALQEADVIVFGPGSLFESLIPNLLLDELRTTIQQSKARKIYICNLMTEPGLTTGFGVSDHIREIKKYGGFTPDYVLVNVQRIEPEVRQMYEAAHQMPIYLAPEESEESTILTTEGVSRRQVIVEDSVVIETDLASSVIKYSTALDKPDEQRAVRVLRHDPQKLVAAILELVRRG
jgi:2-phospho-L-lactate transferase/gluconeogenesis factor (CofD/UPF0052 family)